MRCVSGWLGRMKLGPLLLIVCEMCAGQGHPSSPPQISQSSTFSASSGFDFPVLASQFLSLAPTASADPFTSFGPVTKARLSQGSGLGCEDSESSADLYGHPAIRARGDETLRRLGLCGFSLWAWNEQHQSKEQKREKEGYSPTATHGSPGHIFWLVPAFHVAYLKQFKPLTPREKFDEWLQSTYDPRGLALYAAEAATLEYSSSDGFCGYGKGGAGYGKCFGSVELDANISSFFGDFLFPVIMHQDPRYFRLGQGSFGTRLWYAISRVFVTHSDSGRWVFYSSGLSGTILAAAASNLYYPAKDRGFGPSVSRAGIDLGNTALFNAAAEFWPDISRKIYGVVRIHRLP
jgi:hypothetical protein